MSRLSPFFPHVAIEGPSPRFDKTEPLLIGFSVKNRAFSREFFQNVARLAQECFSRLEIVIVDTPYAFNEAAKRGGLVPSDRELATVRKLGDERFRMITKTLNSNLIAGFPTRVRRWDDFEADSDIQQLKVEMQAAFQRRSTFYEEILQYSSLWSRSLGGVDIEAFSNFLLEEFPVFIKLYYIDKLLVDIYPGPNFTFFQKLEDGVWELDLPLASRSATRKLLSFLNVGGVTATI